MNITFTTTLTMKLSDYIRVVPALSPEDCGDLISCFSENKGKQIKRFNRVQSFNELNYNKVGDKNTLTNLVRKIKTLVEK